MTIEGVRADMDTAQRRFDLEHLFVPLKLLPIPPEIPENDPQREQKLLQWYEEHKKPRPFGEVFAEQDRLGPAGVTWRRQDAPFEASSGGLR